ncbi:MAG TPA: Mur ligase family protein, partial [Blastocatellia bacterium]|nr:Mur ligase family protein [Blastocatellia bacterium]
LLAPPTYFEQVTVISFLYFAECDIDLAVLEVGLGGRLDATNVCEPLVTAITPVSLDHQEYLGNTLTEIAGEKAGIIKPRVPVVVAPQDPQSMKVIAEKARQAGAELIGVDSPLHELTSCEPIQSTSYNPFREGLFEFSYRTPRDEYSIELNLRGEHQVTNARTAIHVAEQLTERDLDLPRFAIELGLRQVVWPGRLEMIEVEDKQRNILLPILLDGAHNIAGAKNLSGYLKQFYADRPITVIFGVLADKAVKEMADLLMPLADQIIATRISSPRTSEPQAIAALAERHAKSVICADSAAKALEQATTRTQANGLICVCGSLYLIGEIKKIIVAKRSTMGF